MAAKRLARGGECPPFEYLRGNSKKNQLPGIFAGVCSGLTLFFSTESTTIVGDLVIAIA